MSDFSFNLDSLNLDDILTAEELTTIDAGAIFIGSPNAPIDVPGYVNGMQNWMQIP